MLDFSFDELGWHSMYNNHDVDQTESINFTVRTVLARHVNSHRLKFHGLYRPETAHLPSIAATICKGFASLLG